MKTVFPSSVWKFLSVGEWFCCFEPVAREGIIIGRWGKEAAYSTIMAGRQRENANLGFQKPLQGHFLSDLTASLGFYISKASPISVASQTGYQVFHMWAFGRHPTII